LRLDGQSAQAEELAPVLARLERRGPDGAAIHCDGAMALGHALLATTDEAAREPMPFLHQPSGCLITGDIRLDNREELIEWLSCDRSAGDGELVLRAYHKGGSGCLARLLGDFAFAIWDPRDQRLFCARDRVGMRQLIYHHHEGRIFAFATEAMALLAHREVPNRVNEARIADFLEGFEAIDLVSTFHEGVLRLPPAHALSVEDGRLRLWRYWQLTAPGPVRRATNAEHEAAFRDVFTKAVRARLRAREPVGAMLSGGMDSGSVVAIAARLLHEAGAPPLKTFSGVDHDPACPESSCIRDSAEHIAFIDPHFASLGDADAFRDAVARLTKEESDPFDGEMSIIRAVYLTARRAGVAVMLDGVAGDTSLSTGDMVAYHLRAGRVARAWREARALEAIWGAQDAAVPAIARAAWRKLAPDWLLARRRRNWRRARELQEALESQVHPALAERIDMPARRRANRHHVTVGEDCRQATRAQRMLHPQLVAARERYDRVAGAIGIEPRDPYLDVRLLEFCLTLPAEQLQGEGWPKLIQRRAMAGLLPDSVRWKRGRHHVGARFIETCVDQSLENFDVAKHSNLGCYANLERASALQCSNVGVASQARLIYLDHWLKSLKPVRD
jgi:asparagine synthase (glutamine-hydrolysing)